MGPVGEMGPPGPTGLKVISEMDGKSILALLVNGSLTCAIKQKNGWSRKDGHPWSSKADVMHVSCVALLQHT